MIQRELTEDDVAKLRMLIGSSAWQEVLKPILAGRIQMHIANLVLDPKQRGEKAAPDEGLRWAIQECQWMMTKPEQIIAQYDHSQRLDERDKALASP